MDVTAAVQNVPAAGELFLGFRLSTTTDDRFLFGPPFTAEPTLQVAVTPIPEPGTAILIGVGTLGLLGYGRRGSTRDRDRLPVGANSSPRGEN